MKKLMEYEALEIADSFEGLVKDLYKESAEGCKQTLKWFIKTIYKHGYLISKEGD
tara:strand:- start:2931 stop:3095 length:165 start_codon:yes stop_codon:yes gene_type:complete